MATSSIRRPVAAWFAACLLAAPAVPALAQTRVATPVEGVAAPVAPAVGAVVSGAGANSIVSPVSFAAPSLYAAPSSPAASISGQVVLAAPASAPAAAAIPSFSAAPVRSQAAPNAASASVRPSAQSAAAPTSASALMSHGTAAPSVFHSQPQSAREADAIATVERGVADWTARSAQALESGAVLAAASEGTGPLERPSARSSAETPAPAAPAPAGEAPSKLKLIMSWAGPILALTALITSIDFGTKYFALHHLFSVFHEVAWRKPIIMGMIPYILYTSYTMRSSMPNDHLLRRWSIGKIFNGSFGFYKAELSGVNTMMKDHPSLRGTLRLYDAAIALMLGGILGNGIDALRLGGALDWIPLGRSLMNFADVSLLLGLSFFQLASSFFIKAAIAHRAGKPLYFNYNWFLGLPLAGVFVAWAFGSAAGGGALDLAMKNVGFLYLMAFSMLIGFARFLAATVLNRSVSRFVSEEAARNAPQAGGKAS